MEEHKKEEVKGRVNNLKEKVDDLFYCIPVETSGGRRGREICEEITDLLDKIIYELGI